MANLKKSVFLVYMFLKGKILTVKPCICDINIYQILQSSHKWCTETALIQVFCVTQIYDFMDELVDNKFSCWQWDTVNKWMYYIMYYTDDMHVQKLSLPFHQSLAEQYSLASGPYEWSYFHEDTGYQNLYLWKQSIWIIHQHAIPVAFFY